MPTLDLHSPIFSARDVVTCTSQDKVGLDSHIHHEHVVPHRMGGRRTFSALQMIEIEIISQLASLFKIPPSVGRRIADHLLSDESTKQMLSRDAAGVTDSMAWINSASDREHADIIRNEDGTTELAPPGTVDGVTIVVPVQHFARVVLVRANRILNGAA